MVPLHLSPSMNCFSRHEQTPLSRDDLEISEHEIQLLMAVQFEQNRLHSMYFKTYYSNTAGYPHSIPQGIHI
jgi:hypothetical protein